MKLARFKCESPPHLSPFAAGEQTRCLFGACWPRVCAGAFGGAGFLEGAVLSPRMHILVHYAYALAAFLYLSLSGKTICFFQLSVCGLCAS